MNADEFKTWWRDYQAKFPSVLGWLNALDPEHQRERFAVWLEVLSPTPLADALAVNKLMATGAVAPVGTFDHERERTAQVVRSEADALRRRRENYYRGERGEAAKAACALCQDTGMVEVFRPAFLAALATVEDWEAIRGKRWRGGRTYQTILCSCESGERKAWKRAEPPPRGFALPQYDPERFCLCPPGRDDDAAIWREAADWYAQHRTASHDANLAAHAWRPEEF